MPAWGRREPSLCCGFLGIVVGHACYIIFYHNLRGFSKLYGLAIRLRKLLRFFNVVQKKFFEKFFAMFDLTCDLWIVIEVFHEKFTEFAKFGLDSRAETDNFSLMPADILNAAQAGFCDVRFRSFAEVPDHQRDHPADDAALEAFERDVLAVKGLDVFFRPAPEFECAHILQGNESGAESVVNIVVGVGDFVGHVHDLAFQVRGGFKLDVCQVVGLFMFQQTVQDFDGQVESVIIGVHVFELFQDAAALFVVLEMFAVFTHGLIQRRLAAVAEWGMPQVVRQRNGFREVFVEAQAAGDIAGDLGDFNGMGEAVAVVVAVIGNKDLGFGLKSAERLGMDNPVSVALEGGAGLILPFFVKTSQAVPRVHGVWRQCAFFVPDEVFLDFEHSGCVRTLRLYHLITTASQIQVPLLHKGPRLNIFPFPDNVAAMGIFEGENLVNLIKAVGYLGLFIIVFAESGLLVGFFLPGDSLLFTAGFLASQGHMNLFAVIALIWVAAVLGDNVGYAFGHKIGPRIFRKEESLLFHKDNLERAQKFYRDHGPKTIILARFVPIVRTFAPILAGVGKMEYSTFLKYNFVGGTVWTFLLTLMGYFLGSLIPDIDKYLLPIIGVIVIISVVPAVYHIVQHRKSSS